MKINSSVSYGAKAPNFGDALSTKQERDYLSLMKKLDEVEGRKDGLKVVKFYTPAFPSKQQEDTGIGKVNSPEAKELYRYAKVYGGANIIKFMPLGQLSDKSVYSDYGYMGAYNRGALTIGEDVIDITKLSRAQWGNILPKSAVNQSVIEHHARSFDKSLIDFDTTLGRKNQEDYPINAQLKLAFKNFKNIKTPNKYLIQMREDFEKFKNQKEPVNYDDIYTRLALFPYLKDPITASVDFFKGFDSNPKIRAKKMPMYNSLKEKYKDEIEFFKFKQFLAHKTIQEAKKEINSLSMELQGDCSYAFSWAEEQMFPDAFLKDAANRPAEAGWGIHALNYYDLINKENSPAHELLRAKVAHFLTNYDCIRFDVGWAYMRPSFSLGHNHYHLDAGDKITSFFERIAREIKGNDFDQRKLMYECDAGYNDFDLWQNRDLMRQVQGLMILSTEDEKNDSIDEGWGNRAFLEQNIGLRRDDFILQTNNHDKEGVLNCASNKAKSSEQTGALMRVFGLRPWEGHSEGWRYLKDDEDMHNHLVKYSRARFAEVEGAKHQAMLYTDMMGRREKVDYHTGGVGYNSERDYKNRLEDDCIQNAHRALQDDIGYNRAAAKVFAAKMSGNYDRYRPLYEQAEKYARYIAHKGGIYSRAQADASKRANLDIGKLNPDEIDNLDVIC